MMGLRSCLIATETMKGAEANRQWKKNAHDKHKMVYEVYVSNASYGASEWVEKTYTEEELANAQKNIEQQIMQDRRREMAAKIVTAVISTVLISWVGMYLFF